MKALIEFERSAREQADAAAAHALLDSVIAEPLAEDADHGMAGRFLKMSVLLCASHARWQRREQAINLRRARWLRARGLPIGARVALRKAMLHGQMKRLALIEEARP